jgi:hypothetical protein
VVKGEMFAIQKHVLGGRKKYAKDFQSALHVEDLAANFAKTGDINQLQHGLFKLHEEASHATQNAQHSHKSQYDHREYQ